MVEPGPTPVMTMVAPTAFAGIVTEAGKAATLVLSEVSVMVSDVGVGAGRATVTFWVPPAWMVMVCGTKTSDAVTFAVCVADVNAGAEAVMFTLPTATPVI